MALRFLGEGNESETSVDYATLDRRARALAAQLAARGALGQRVLVLHAPGLDYVVSLFACLYAGAVAVPAYPPRAGRPLTRMHSVVADSKAAFALTSQSILERIARRVQDEPAIAGLHWIATDSVDESDAKVWRDPGHAASALAILQYTSGSTSEPKGVMLSQSHFVNNVEALVRHGGLLPEDRVVSWLPPYHDMGLLSAILLPVCTGTQALLMSPSAFLQQPLRWLSAISRHRGTISGGPNFAYDLCVRRIPPEQRAALDLSSWRVAFSGAERVRAETIERFAEAFAPAGFSRANFMPCYGLAEATLGVTFSMRDDGPVLRDFDAQEIGHGRACEARSDGTSRRLVSAGRVLPDSELRIVNRETRSPEPDGTIGEIWVRSRSVANGYYGQPELSERVFRAHLAENDEHTFLRTGDLGFSIDGELFVTGRIKDLIILRGVNHYPEDIEATVESSHPRLRPAGGAACCVDIEGEERLIVVHEVDAARDLPSEEIAGAVRRAVADEHQLIVHEVLFVGPAALPKTSSGKVRRHAIAEAYADGSLSVVARSVLPSRAEHAAAPPELVRALRRAMAAVLNVDDVGPDEDFFELGGHSLMATQLASRVRQELNVELPLSLVFEAATPATLALEIAALPAAEPLPPVTRIARDQPLPLSYSQERMWFLHQVEPEGSAYNVSGAVTLEGPLSTQALFAAFTVVMQRHEVLRTRYAAVDGEPELRVTSDASLVFEEHDLRRDASPEERARELSSALAHRPFDIARESLIRGALYRVAATRHVLCISMHHLITDAWSMGVLTREVLEAYVALSTGGEPPRNEERIQYADYAGWQRRHFSNERLTRELDYWKRELAGVPALDLPFDKPAPAAATSRGALLPLQLSAELLRSLRELGVQQGSTLFMVMLAAFQVVLHRYSGQTDLVLGVPIANRNHLTSEGFMGTLVNTLALRVQFEPEVTFEQLLRETRQRSLGAYAHQDLPFERLVAELPLARNTGRSPLIQAMFDFQNAPLPNLEAASFRLEPFVISRGAAQFDLSVLVMDTELGQSIGFEYSTDRFSAEAIERLAAHYIAVLESVIGDPAQPIAKIPLLRPAERRALLEVTSRTCHNELVTTPVPATVAALAQQVPDKIAVIDDDGQTSYAELERRSNALAVRLQARGVGPGDRLAVYLNRSRELPVALLAVLKTGAAYVPLDPRYPAARIEQVLEDARPRLIVTEEALLAALPEALRSQAVTFDSLDEARAHELVPCAIRPEMAAYVIYTSGSTGRPKGVEVSHGGLTNFLVSMAAEPGLTEADTLLSVTTVAFDISGLELFLPLVSGGAVRVVKSEVANDGDRLRALLEAPEISVMQATPATWKLLIEAGFQGKSGLKILCGGEAMPRDLADQLLARADSVWNLYGPTETTIWSTVQRVQPGREPISIGAAILHTRMYVLDGERELCPFGAVGEIYIGGAGVANGYLNRADLTSERFFADPFAGSGARMYRTGDLGKLRADGSLEYLGRADHQIKLRGFRIEPGEIETVIKRHAGVRDTVVLAREDRPGDVRLVCYYVPETAGSELGAELRGSVARSLPEYMVPAAFVGLDCFPQTPNGKLDRKLLPAPAAADVARAEELVPPRDALEERLERLWQGVLGGSQFGVRDNFFAIGGHSLLAVRLLSRIRKELGIEIAVATLMQGPTIERLAEHIRACDEQAGPPPSFSFLVPLRKGYGERVFCVHGAGGDVLGLRQISAHLDEGLAFYGIQARGVDGTSTPFTRIEDMADAYLGEIRSVQAHGPYHLSGYCGGGVVAFEMAQRLHAAGEQVASLVLLDAHRPGSVQHRSRKERWAQGFARQGVGYFFERAAVFVRRETYFAYVRLVIFLHVLFGRAVPHELRNAWLTWAFFRAEACYRAPVYAGQLTLLRPEESSIEACDGGPDFGWTNYAAGVEVHGVPGNHDSLVREPHVAVVAATLGACVNAARTARTKR